jgi:tRNA A22 N-methylase
VDVGTESRYLPIWLLLNGRSEKAYASYIRPGPLRNAAATPLPPASGTR